MVKSFFQNTLEAAFSIMGEVLEEILKGDFKSALESASVVKIPSSKKKKYIYILDRQINK